MRSRSRIELAFAILLIACSLAAVAPSLAAATTFCVNPIAGQQCSGTSEADLQTALTAASTAPNNTHANTVIVGNPGPAPASGYTYTTPNPVTNPVSLVGAGRSATTLTYSGGGPSTVLSMSGDGSSVSNLQVLLPASGGTAVTLSGGHANNILVTSPGPQTNNLDGVVLAPGSTPSAPQGALTNSAISFPTSGAGSQVGLADIVGSLVEDDSIAGQNTAPAIEIATPPPGYPNAYVVRRVSVATTVATTGYGMLISGAAVNVDNLSLRLAGAASGSSFGFIVQASGSNDATVNLNHVSAYGNGDAVSSPFNSIALIQGASSGKTATTNVRNSILRNFFLTTARTASGAGSVSNVRYDYTDYDVLHHTDMNTSGGTGATTRGVGDLDDADPGWPNPAAGNFTLPPGSPVINQGDPAPLNPATESTTDILGQPRISGGRRDMGAVEFQFPAPSFRLGSGTFDPKTGKVALKATCVRATGGQCHFKLTLKAKVKQKRGGKKKTKQITLKLNGSVASGASGNLRGKLSHSGLKALAALSKVRFSVTGTVTDSFGVTTNVKGHVKLKPAMAHKKKKH